MESEKKEARELRCLVSRARPAGHHAYPAEVKRRVQDYVEDRIRAGLSLRRIAVEVGVNHFTLRFWRDQRLKKSGSPKGQLRAVQVVGRATSESQLVLHAPHGIRVEGLTTSGLAELLGKLQ